MTISTVIQILVELIAGLLLAMATLIMRQQRQGLMLSMPNGNMLPGDLWELKRAGLQPINISKGGVNRV